MDNKKKIDSIRKRNIELTNELQEMRSLIKFYSDVEEDGEFDDLISDLENIREEWYETLKDLKKKSDEYSSLINELLEVRKIMYSMGFKIPFYKKIWMKFKR